MKKYLLIGAPNVGKSTVFKALTGGKVSIGNYPGITVESSIGLLDNQIELVDLPGLYSLIPLTKEEELTVKMLNEKNYDGIFYILDVTNIQKSLFLYFELRTLDVPMVIFMNKMDYIDKLDYDIHKKRCEILFPCPIFYISGRNLKRTRALKKELIPVLKNLFPPPKIQISFDKKQDVEALYQYIEKFQNKMILPKKHSRTFLERLDSILLSKRLAVFFFFFILLSGFSLSLFIGSFGKTILENLLNEISNNVEFILLRSKVNPHLVSFLIKGVLNGVGQVLTFLPQFYLIYLFMSLLEDTGYFARISFVMDSFFESFHLNGRSVICYLLGSTCNITGVMATRTIVDSSERKKTICTMGFIPCQAKIPVILLFCSCFFPVKAFWICFFIFLSGILLLFIFAYIYRIVFHQYEYPSFYELPYYQKPSIRMIVSQTNDKTKLFLKRASTIILLGSVLLWIGINYSFSFTYTNYENSILGIISRKIHPIFYPILKTNDTRFITCFLSGLFSKEQFISSYYMLYKNGDPVWITMPSFISFLFLYIFSIPCLGTIRMMRLELQERRILYVSMLFQEGIIYLFSILIVTLLGYIL